MISKTITINYLKKNREFSLILFVALILRFILAWYKEFHADELYNLLAAEMILEKGVPVYPSGVYRILGGLMLYIQAPFVGLFGYEQLFVRIPSVLFSISAVFMVYHFARQLFGKNVALLAVFFTAFDTDLINWGGISCKPYSLTPLLVICIYYFLRKGAVSNNLRALIYTAILIVLSLWIHPLLALFLPAIFISYLIWVPKFRLKHLLIFTSIIVTGITVVFLSAYYLDQGLFVSTGNGEKANYIGLLKGYGLKLYTAIFRFYSDPFYTSHFHRIIVFFPFVFIILAGLINLVFGETKKVWKNQVSKDILALGTSVIITLIIHNILPFNFVYYTIPLLGLFYIVGSYSIILLFKGKWYVTDNFEVPESKKLLKKQKLFIGVFFLLVFIWMMKDLKVEFKNTNYLDAYKYVKKEWKNGDAILSSNPATYIFAIGERNAKMYYFTENPGIGIMKNKQNKYVDRVFAMPGITDTLQLDSLFHQHNRIWYILNLPKKDFNVPTTLEFIHSNMKKVYNTNTLEVYLKE